MFTGLVEAKGEIETLNNSADGLTLWIKNATPVLTDCHLGDSIACNGVCLTVTEFTQDRFCVGISPETVRKTNLATLKIGDKVNLERAMDASTRFGGHMVQGHVDCTVLVSSVENDPPNSVIFKFKTTPKFLQYIVTKGYVCLDGTSLTVIDVDWASLEFSIMLVEYTQSRVIMTSKKPGDSVNLEVDQMGKYVENVVRGMLESGTGPVHQFIENAVNKLSGKR